MARFTKLHPSAALPRKSKVGDAGYDVFVPCQDFSKLHPTIETIDDPRLGLCFVVRPGKKVKLDLQLRFFMEPGWVCKVENRSSVSDKHHLLVGAGVIDGNYEGNIKVILMNVSDDHRAIIPVREAIAQLIFVRCFDSRVDTSDLTDSSTTSVGAVDTYTLPELSKGQMDDLYNERALEFHSSQRRGVDGFGSSNAGAAVESSPEPIHTTNEGDESDQPKHDRNLDTLRHLCRYNVYVANEKIHTALAKVPWLKPSARKNITTAVKTMYKYMQDEAAATVADDSREWIERGMCAEGRRQDIELVDTLFERITVVLTWLNRSDREVLQHHLESVKNAIDRAADACPNCYHRCTDRDAKVIQCICKQQQQHVAEDDDVSITGEVITNDS